MEEADVGNGVRKIRNSNGDICVFRVVEFKMLDKYEALRQTAELAVKNGEF
jgi:hypothetical protein